MRPKQISEATLEKLHKCLEFAAKLERMPNGDHKPLPEHLQQQKDMILAEIQRRASLGIGDHI